MDRFKEIETIDDHELDTDRRENFSIGVQYTERSQEILGVLIKIQEMSDGLLSRIDMAQHCINSAPYRAGPKVREIGTTEIDNMLRMNVLEPSLSEWASPIVFTQKKDGFLRLCIDCRKLNAVTVKDAYIIPRLDECLGYLGKPRILSTLDANYGY